jgi:hypothetical protein
MPFLIIPLKISVPNSPNSSINSFFNAIRFASAASAASFRFTSAASAASFRFTSAALASSFRFTSAALSFISFSNKLTLSSF